MDGAQSRNPFADLRRFKPALKPMPKPHDFSDFERKNAILDRLEPF